MKRGWGSKGFELPEQTIWLVSQGVLALVMVLLLWGYIDSAISGGYLAKQFYPGEFGLLATAVAQCPDNMIMSSYVDKFKDTAFSFSGGAGIIAVTSNKNKEPSRFWVFTPSGTGLATFSLENVSGYAHIIKEGNAITMRMEKNFSTLPLRCVAVPTQDTNWRARAVAVSAKPDGRQDMDKGLADITARLRALGQGGSQGIAIVLSADPVVDDKTRIVAYFNPDASQDVQQRSMKLGCMLINALQQSPVAGAIDASVVAPAASTSLPLDVPGVELVIGQSGAKEHLLANPTEVTKALYAGIGGYYG